MKKSSKLLLTAILILVISIGIYNAALKAEYRKGTYKDPYHGFTSLNLKNFNALELNAGSVIGVKIIKGDYQVRVHNLAAEFIKVKQEKQKLKVDVVYPEARKGVWADYHVIISCPELQSLNTNTIYKTKNILVTDKGEIGYKVSLEGMSQEKLQINMDNASRVLLAHNKINVLEAVAGLSTGSSSELNLAGNNQVQAAHLDIRNKSQLVLDNLVIPDLTYTFSDSAILDMKGSALKLLKK